MQCFSMMPRAATVCPVCGQAAVALTARSYREKLAAALHHPLAEVRMRAIIALGLRREEEAAGDLAECAFRHPQDMIEGLEIVKSLNTLPRGQPRYQALQDLCERHPATVVRIAAMGALAGMPPAKSQP
jgi:hypothetical protein